MRGAGARRPDIVGAVVLLNKPPLFLCDFEGEQSPLPIWATSCLPRPVGGRRGAAYTGLRRAGVCLGHERG
jgi:hypothetical protein